MINKYFHMFIASIEFEIFFDFPFYNYLRFEANQLFDWWEWLYQNNQNSNLSKINWVNLQILHYSMKVTQKQIPYQCFFFAHHFQKKKVKY